LTEVEQELATLKRELRLAKIDSNISRKNGGLDGRLLSHWISVPRAAFWSFLSQCNKKLPLVRSATVKWWNAPTTEIDKKEHNITRTISGEVIPLNPLYQTRMLLLGR